MRLVLTGDENDMYSWVWIHPMFFKQLFAPGSKKLKAYGSSL